MNSILSQLREAGYDVGLQGEEIALEYVGDGQPDAAVVEPLLAEVAARKGEMICILGASRVEPGVGAGDSERLSELLEKESRASPELSGEQSTEPATGAT